MLGLSLFGLMSQAYAAVTCGASAAGVLNVGILPVNLPYSAVQSGVAVGFDPLLIEAAATLLGYNKVNFIGYSTAGAAIAALNSGAIDVYANSRTPLATHSPYSTIGVVTDISNELASGGIPNGWLVNITCCRLALLLEAAVTQLVENGTYARILQEVRFAGLADGRTLGISTLNNPTGALQEPDPFASSEVGTIPSACLASGPVGLPPTNCISAFLQANCLPPTTFTGATGQLG